MSANDPGDHGSDHGPGSGSGHAGGREEAGSLGEEAAKLLQALQGRTEGGGRDPGAAATAAASAAAAASAVLHDVDAHLSTGAPQCQYCPVCQLVSAVRGASPEVRAHLRTAGSSLMQAAAAMLAPPTAPPTAGPKDRRRDRDVERIDVGDDEWED
jgi:hypothetical protein